MILLSSLTYGQGTKPLSLYPNGVPNSKPVPVEYIEKTESDRVAMVTDPTITPFFPEKGKANGAAVIICPGGGYAQLAIEHEGYAVAKEFTKIGVTAFVLKYRLPSDAIMSDKSIGPLQDAQMAMLIVRTHAAEWGINPNKVGIMGFSAGGHLASTAGTHFNKAVIENKNNINLRPDFMLLLYPVISFGEMAHKGSKDNLLGKDAPASQIDLYSNEKQVTANTPITFIVHAEDDKTVPIQNSLQFYDALVKNNVKAEMHIFQAGGHGFGLNNPTSVEHWFEWCTNWMGFNGLLNGH
jgi:acetyl esterase/lipase